MGDFPPKSRKRFMPDCLSALPVRFFDPRKRGPHSLSSPGKQIVRIRFVPRYLARSVCPARRPNEYPARLRSSARPPV